jgi:hypothetical protein
MASNKQVPDHRQQIRLPGDLAAYIKERAAHNDRSFTSEVAFRLKQSRQQEEAAKRP